MILNTLEIFPRGFSFEKVIVKFFKNRFYVIDKWNIYKIYQVVTWTGFLSSAGGGTPPCPEHRSLTFFVRSAALAPSILSTWDLFCNPRNTLGFLHQCQCNHYRYEQDFKCLATFGNCIHLPHLKNMTLCHWISMISKDINRVF